MRCVRIALWETLPLIPSPPQIAWRARLFNSPFSYLNWYASGVKTKCPKTLLLNGSPKRAQSVCLLKIPLRYTQIANISQKVSLQIGLVSCFNCISWLFQHPARLKKVRTRHKAHKRAIDTTEARPSPSAWKPKGVLTFNFCRSLLALDFIYCPNPLLLECKAQ